MRRIGVSIAVVVGLAAAYGLGRFHSHGTRSGKVAHHVAYYVDPMHPAYRSDKPGIAPDCGMPLEPVIADDEGRVQLATHVPPGTVTIDGATQRLLGIKLATVERSGVARAVRVVGRVVPQDTRVYRVNPGVDGFIKETYSDSAGTFVKKDQKLATYYSPDFLSTASGFLAATERVPGSTGKDGAKSFPFPGAVAKQGVSSVQGYTDRLRNLGMSDAQIKLIADNRQLPENIDVVAPADGFILARNITAGQHFERNMEFYRIADLSQVWVVAEIDEQDTMALSPGRTAKVILKDAGRQLIARVADSLPESQPGGGTVKLRLELDNPHLMLRPDMLVDVELPVQLQAGISVPADALIDTGAGARVYVEHGDGVFEPRAVETGWRSGGRVQIVSGIRPGERVVATATFLVDSESRLKNPSLRLPALPVANKRPAPLAGTARTGMVKDPNCGMLIDSAKAAAAGNKLAYRGTVYYFCSGQCKQAFQSGLAGEGAKHKGDDDD